MGARLKAVHGLATMIGWQARRFHHMKQPKPLHEYLEPAPSPERKREIGAKKVRAMFERVKRKQEAKDGTR